jgi:CheY-like chemotaxis protein
MAALQKIFPSLPILVVDDDEESLLALATTLRTASVTNLRTISDSTAVPTMLGLEAFSLVLLDLNMPGLSGYEILGKAAELTCRPPFIIVTGSLPPPDFVMRLTSDVVAYLTKPVDRERLVRAVLAVLGGSR